MSKKVYVDESGVVRPNMREVFRNHMEKESCVDGLLPDGEICPKCGEKRAPSGVGGGTWVHVDQSIVRMNKDKNATWLVDGIQCATKGFADILAARLYKRYDGYRSINIICQDEHGNREVVDTLEASKTPEEVDNEDWVG